MSTTAERAAAIGLPWDHTEYVCDGEHFESHCMFCDGGLTACTVCGAFEGATTTQCPGYQVTHDQWNEVYAGTLDYRHGQWVQAESVYSPGGYAQLLTDDEKNRIQQYNSTRKT